MAFVVVCFCWLLGNLSSSYLSRLLQGVFNTHLIYFYKPAVTFWWFYILLSIFKFHWYCNGDVMISALTLSVVDRGFVLALSAVDRGFECASIKRRVWRYQRGNQKPYIEEQTTQWPKENSTKGQTTMTKHAYKTKDGVTRTHTKNRGWTQVLRKGKQFLLH